jgi:hypothetical protein
MRDVGSTAPVVSCSDRMGQPFRVHEPGVDLVSVTLAVMVPAAPSPSTNTPVKSLPTQVDPVGTVVATVVLVVLVVDVVVVVVFEPIACRLTVKITTIAAKIASIFNARLTD